MTRYAMISRYEVHAIVCLEGIRTIFEMPTFDDNTIVKGVGICYHDGNNVMLESVPLERHPEMRKEFVDTLYLMMTQKNPEGLPPGFVCSFD